MAEQEKNKCEITITDVTATIHTPSKSNLYLEFYGAFFAAMKRSPQLAAESRKPPGIGTHLPPSSFPHTPSFSLCGKHSLTFVRPLFSFQFTQLCLRQSVRQADCESLTQFASQSVSQSVSQSLTRPRAHALTSARAHPHLQTSACPTPRSSTGTTLRRFARSSPTSSEWHRPCL